MLTTNATAQLLHRWGGGVNSAIARMALMERNRLNPDDGSSPENQVTGFWRRTTPRCPIVVKGSWTSQVRHDAAYIELPSQRPYLLVVFTEGTHSQNQDFAFCLPSNAAAARQAGLGAEG